MSNFALKGSLRYFYRFTRKKIQIIDKPVGNFLFFLYSRKSLRDFWIYTFAINRIHTLVIEFCEPAISYQGYKNKLDVSQLNICRTSTLIPLNLLEPFLSRSVLDNWSFYSFQWLMHICLEVIEMVRTFRVSFIGRFFVTSLRSPL